jgi:hypothetical protein
LGSRDYSFIGRQKTAAGTSPMRSSADCALGGINGSIRTAALPHYFFRPSGLWMRSFNEA